MHSKYKEVCHIFRVHRTCVWENEDYCVLGLGIMTILIQIHNYNSIIINPALCYNKLYVYKYPVVDGWIPHSM